MAHVAVCRAAFSRAAISNIASRNVRTPVQSNVSTSLVSSFRGFRLGVEPVRRNGRKIVGIVMAEGLNMSEADEEAFLAEKKAKLAAKRAGKEGEEKTKRPKTEEEKAAYKKHLRRRRLDRKRKLRKQGRWPPLKANVNQPSNPRKRVKRKAK